MLLHEIAPDLWTFTYPVRMMGMDMGSRTTIFRLSSDNIALHSPGTMSPELIEAIEALGTVKHLIAPTLTHHRFLGEVHDRWPTARILAPEGLGEKRPDLRIDAVMAPRGELSPDIPWLRVEGIPKLNEHVFLHRPSGTLVLTDLCFNYRDHPQRRLRLAMGLNGVYGRLGPSRVLRLLMTHGEAVLESIDQILAWDWDRITLAHGSPVPEGGKEMLRQAFSFLRK